MNYRFETHCHSHYSNIRLLDCISKIPDIIKTAYDLGLAGVALTDHEALCGHIEWLEAERELKKSGRISENFKCALGNEIYLTDTREQKQKYYHAILIALDAEGHHQLRELSSTAWLNSYKYHGMERVPTLKTELEEIVKKNPGHLIFQNACLGGELDTLILQMLVQEKGSAERQKFQEKINNWILYFNELFGENFYIEIASGNSKELLAVNKVKKNLARAYNKKIVIGGDAHYLTEKDRPIHKAFLNSKDGDREVDSFYQFTYLMDNEECYDKLKDIFSREEFDEICNNSLEIMNKISDYNLFKSPIIPEVKVKDYQKTTFFNKESILNELGQSDNIQERYWVNQCIEAMRARKQDIIPEYVERLETEADVLKTISNKLNNCMFSYFNTFQHYIDLFWECGSIVGPGRGSACGFLSNYYLGITQLDAIRWNLPWFRFLNKDRAELPD